MDVLNFRVTHVMDAVMMLRPTGAEGRAELAALLCALGCALFLECLGGFLLVRFLLLHALRHNLPPVMVERILRCPQRCSTFIHSIRAKWNRARDSDAHVGLSEHA